MTGPAPGQFVVSRGGEVVRCPWHGWEFDILTGRSLYNPHRVRVRRYEVSVERGDATNTGADDPRIETFAVSVEQDWVMLHLER